MRSKSKFFLLGGVFFLLLGGYVFYVGKPSPDLISSGAETEPDLKSIFAQG